MNYTQNNKISQVSEKTLVVGIDIGSETHFVRCFDWRGIEFTKKPFSFTNSRSGFDYYLSRVTEIMQKHGKDDIIVGCEPTGHYWMTFAKYLKEHDMNLVFVNPYHVKQCKELDDNSPNKTDRKDPKTIANLVKDGRYSVPYIPEGIYADLREVMTSRDRIVKELNAATNRIHRWLKIYFPEYLTVYKKFDSISGFMVLKEAPLPKDIVKIGAEGINQLWRAAKQRAVGIKRAQTLVEAARNSIGIEGGRGAAYELRQLLDDYVIKKRQLEEVTEIIAELVSEVEYADKLLSIKGVGIVTVAGFLSEVGDVSRFTSPKQIQKLAGLELRENSSGKHKGRTTISKRGRRKLRRILFQVVLPLIKSNKEFRDVYNYYTERRENPLKGRQAMIAVSCKLIRIFYALLKKGITYDADRFRRDIVRRQELKAA